MKSLKINQILIGILVVFGYSTNCKAQLNWSWAKAFGGEYDQYVSDFIADNNGNLYVAGTFCVSAEFDTQKYFPKQGGFGGYFAKFDNLGKFIWSKRVDTDTENKRATGIVIDSNENIYVSGLKNKGTYFLNKYSKDGDIIWSRNFDTCYYDMEHHKVLTVSNNLICVAGNDSLYTFNNNGDIISRKKLQIDCIYSNNDGFFYVAKNNRITRLDTLLNEKSIVELDSAKLKINSFLIINNFVYATGGFDRSGGGYLDMFIAKADSEGKVKWIKKGIAEEYGSAEGNSIAMDSHANLCVAGYYRNVVHFDTLKLGAFGLFSEAFVARYTESGELENFIHGGGDGEDVAVCLSLTSNNDILVAGNVEYPKLGSVNFGDINVNSSYGTDLFIAKASEFGIQATLNGKITIGGIQKASQIKIFKKNLDETYQTIYHGLTDESGNYSFTLNNPGQYLLKAENFENVGTYYKQTYLWNLADPVIINKDTIIDNLNIDIIQNSTIVGEDSITGTVYNFSGQPKSFSNVLLVTIDDQFIAFTRSDTVGNYCFVKVAKGNYKILIDSAGVLMNSYYTINNSLKSTFVSNSLNSRLFSGYDYIFGQDHKIYTKSTASIRQIWNKEKFVTVYPNPLNEHLDILKIRDVGLLIISIFDVTGKCLYKTKMESDFLQINTSKFLPGIYNLVLEKNNSDKQVIKLVKAK